MLIWCLSVIVYCLIMMFIYWPEAVLTVNNWIIISRVRLNYFDKSYNYVWQQSFYFVIICIIPVCFCLCKSDECSRVLRNVGCGKLTALINWSLFCSHNSPELLLLLVVQLCLNVSSMEADHNTEYQYRPQHSQNVDIFNCEHTKKSEFVSSTDG